MQLACSTALAAGLLAVLSMPTLGAPDSTLRATSSTATSTVSKALVLNTDLPVFKTEPKFAPVAFDYIRRAKDRSLIAPGYLFFTVGMKGGHVSRGAQIMDQKGNLIWHSRRKGRQNLHVCDFLGSSGDHLCVHKQTEENAVILDNTYTQVSKAYPSDNGHEMRVLNGGKSLLRVVNELKQHDLTPYTGNPEGWVIDTCFDETDVLTGDSLFRWCPLDHLHIWESTLYMQLKGSLGRENRSISAHKAGKGTENAPWDFFHSNSMDKHDGDYLLSGRHCDVILKIAGPQNRHGVKPGTVLWRLGGRLNDFKKDFVFTRQHSVRFQSVSSTETIISIFNNGWEGDIKPSANVSDGQIIKINNKTMEATLLNSYPHPDGAISEGRGNTQILPNGNVLNAYGRFPDITEHLHNGTVLDQIRYSQWSFDRSPDIPYHKGTYSYRVFKQPWVGRPKDPPKLLAYRRTCSIAKTSPLIAYVSWNGATEVESWRFQVSFESQQGPWLPTGTFKKTGFETRARLNNVTLTTVDKLMLFVSVEGLDADGKVLGATTSRIFTPKLSFGCGETGCDENRNYSYPRQDSRDCYSETSFIPQIMLIFLILSLELASYMKGLTLCYGPFSDSASYGQGTYRSKSQTHSEKDEHVAFISDLENPEVAFLHEKDNSYDPG